MGFAAEISLISNHLYYNGVKDVLLLVGDQLIQGQNHIPQSRDTNQFSIFILV